MNKLAIVVLNWNGADMMPRCLNSLIKQSYTDFQIVVVDNQSKDNSKEILTSYQKKLKDKLHVIYNDKNSGFAGGVNIGIRYALENNFDGVALFNNDATPDKDWLSNLARTLNEKKDVGIVTSLILHEDGKTIDSTGDWYTKWGLSSPLFRDKDAKETPESDYIFAASGGASLYRASLLKDIGLFDEAFFAYYEDIDISFRAQLAGYKVYYQKSAVVYHEQGGTSKKIPGFGVYVTFKNLPILFIKNVPRQLLLKIGSRFFVAYWLMFFNTIHRGSFLYALKGWVSSLYYTPYAILERMKIQKNKRVSADYIDSIIYQDLPPLQSGLRKFRSLFIGGNK